jgi:hypothetical protein
MPPAAGRHHRPRPGRALLLLAWILATAAGLEAQATGTILGRVVDAGSGDPLASVSITLSNHAHRTMTTEDGRFILVAVPTGEHALRAELIGRQTVTLEGIRVTSGRAVDVRIELALAPIELEGVTVDATRLRLMNPEITVSHELLVGRELRELPLERLQDAIELAPGVTGGHFRGGRMGQEVYIIDGVEVKNQLEASTRGLGLEFAPGSLEELEVITGGFGAEYGSALSGVVKLSTRRGNAQRWEGRSTLLSDRWAGERAGGLGFSAVALSGGGPLRLLGAGTTVFGDIHLQETLDAEPRARGLTCLRPGDVDAELGLDIQALQQDMTAGHLYCPASSRVLPHQAGEKAIVFGRIDRALGGGGGVMLSLLANRNQRQLYTPAFKYNHAHQLGDRFEGGLANVGVHWTSHRLGRAVEVSARGTALRMDRQLGPMHVTKVADGTGFGLSPWTIVGQDFVRRPIAEQLESGEGIPGYSRPGGSVGSPFGPGGEGLFFTEGTPDIANWTRMDALGGDGGVRFSSAVGHVLELGATGKAYRIESYERVLGHVRGVVPFYARFYPGTAATYAQATIAAADDVMILLGMRFEGFRPGIDYQRDRQDVLSPVIETSWRWNALPRLGVAAPVPGTGERTAFRFNYGRIAQAPDFRYFLDTSIGDSLRTDVRRQGNPDLIFERGAAYEVALSQLVNERLALSVTMFRKEFHNLVAGNLDFAGVAEGQFTTGDFGSANGVELQARGRVLGGFLRASYALQYARGVAAGALDDERPEAGAPRVEFPLPFDRRHAVTTSWSSDRLPSGEERRWSAAAVFLAMSGTPIDRRGAEDPTAVEYLPWTSYLNARAVWTLPVGRACPRCAVRLVGEARNLLGRENVLGVRRDTHLVGPSAATARAIANATPALDSPIPRDSPRYSRYADINGDGLITEAEYRLARYAAVLDLHDPSLYFGEPRQLRLGLEVRF